MVIAEQGQGYNQVQEFNFNPVKFEWYKNKNVNWFNKNIKNVLMDDYFSILIGSNSHRIIWHSIYQEFQPTQIKQRDFQYLYTPGINDGKLICLNKSERGMCQLGAFIGIAKTKIIMNKFSLKNPQIECYPQSQGSQYSGVKIEYTVTYNYTNCAEKETHQDLSDYVMCQQKQILTINVLNVYLSDKHKNLLITIIVIVVMISIALIIWITYYIYRYKHRSKALQREIDQLSNESVKY